MPAGRHIGNKNPSTYWFDLLGWESNPVALIHITQHSCNLLNQCVNMLTCKLSGGTSLLHVLSFSRNIPNSITKLGIIARRSSALLRVHIRSELSCKGALVAHKASLRIFLFAFVAQVAHDVPNQSAFPGTHASGERLRSDWLSVFCRRSAS